jgi:hypothetical protein
VTDIHGNYAIPTYYKYYVPGQDSVRAAYPQSVYYYASGGSLLFTVMPSWQLDRTDLPLDGTDNPAPLVMEVARLANLHVYVGGTSLFRRYEFGHQSTSTIGCSYSSSYIYYAGHMNLSNLTVKGWDGATVLDSLTFNYGPAYQRITYGGGLGPLPCGVSSGSEVHWVAGELDHPYLISATNMFGGSVTFVYSQTPVTPVTGKWTRHTVTSRTASPGSATGGTDITTNYSYSADPEYSGTGSNAEFRGFRLVTETFGDSTQAKHYFYTTGMFTVPHPVYGDVSRDADRLKGRRYQFESLRWPSGPKVQKTFDDWNFVWVDSVKDIYEVQLSNFGVETYDLNGNLRRRAWNHQFYDYYQGQQHGYGNVFRLEEFGVRLFSFRTKF